jgi:hypothetical protein
MDLIDSIRSKDDPRDEISCIEPLADGGRF